MSDDKKRRVSILGATGSVGRSTVSLIEENPSLFTVEALTANRDAEALAAVARKIGAKLAVVADPSAYGALKAALAGTGIEAAAGNGGRHCYQEFVLFPRCQIHRSPYTFQIRGAHGRSPAAAWRSAPI